MRFSVDEIAIRNGLKPIFDTIAFRRGIENIANDPVLLAHFLMTMREGECMGDSGLGKIMHDAVAELMDGMEGRRREERRHCTILRSLAVKVDPTSFASDDYRFEESLTGREIYLNVLSENRARLRKLGKLSRLNLYLTTTFGYETVLGLIFRLVVDALGRSHLPSATRHAVKSGLETLIADLDALLGPVDQHKALRSADRQHLAPAARAEIAMLERLEPEDYAACAASAAGEIVRAFEGFAKPALFIEQMRASVDTKLPAQVVRETGGNKHPG